MPLNTKLGQFLIWIDKKSATKSQTKRFYLKLSQVSSKYQSFLQELCANLWGKYESKQS